MTDAQFPAPLFAAVEAKAREWLRPGEGIAVDILGEIVASPDAKRAAATSIVCDVLEGYPSTRITLIDLATGTLKVVTNGPRSDRSPRWSPDGRLIAFLSDRDQAHLARLRLLDLATGEDRATTTPDGWVEYHHWSADGKSLLLGVAGFGADLSGAQGGFSIAARDEERPAWAPDIDAGANETAWRSAWIYDLASDTVRKVSPAGVNIWEAVWCGPDRIAAICSDTPDEAAWYVANVRVLDVKTGKCDVVFTPKTHLGWLSASPSGARLAVVEAICSDRTIVAGDLRLIELKSGTVTEVETLSADVVQTVWRGEDHILFAAAQGPDSIIGLFGLAANMATEIWRERVRTPSGMRFPEVAGLGQNPGDCLFAREGFFDPQTLVAIRDGRASEILRFNSPVDDEVASLGTAASVSWTAPDGLTINGWLMCPRGLGPYPLILEVHGGPVWYYRPRYIGRTSLYRMLLAAGYAILQVNPRGSSGRGQDFAGRVFGDMGGADTHDYLSGLDAMVEQGIADPKRLGVTGGSYGGYMSSWLITQTDRFAAAVPVAPVTDWVSEHLTSHIPFFCEIFLEDKIDNPTGKYFTRSPIHFADRVKTPTLNICGAKDKNTPAGQALEFHHALLLNGVTSVLVTYPQEGHGVRNMPASFDYAARVIDWFQRYMPAAAK